MTLNSNSITNYLRNKALTDIRFWIVLFFILRLYGITNPPLEIAHNWRQVCGSMVARNFYEVDNNILYPRIDMAGEKTGIIGMEFPILNYLTYLLSLLFGFHDWFGRMIVLIVSSFGTFYFYKLLKLKFDERISFYSAFLFLTSMWFMYARKVMPETVATSLVIMSLYFAFRYFMTGKWLHAVLYFVLITIGILSKISAAYPVMLLLFPLLDARINIKQKVYIALLTGVVMTVVVVWYFYWVPLLASRFEYGNFYIGTSFSNGLQEILSNKVQTAEKFYFESLKFIGFAAFLFGLLMAILKKEKVLLLTLFMCSFSFSILIIKVGFNFPHHSYYVIPFVPVMCLLAGYGITQIKKQGIQTLLLFAITFESIADQQHDFRIKESEKYKLRMESIADLIIDKNALCVINGGENPQQIYFLHRKGWSVETNKLTDPIFINYLDDNHCKYVFINKHNGMPSGGVHGVGRIVYNDKDFVIYKFE